MTSKRAGRVLIALGALCIIAAVVLLCHNRAEERRADDAAQSAMPAVVQGIAEARAVRTNTAPARDPDVGVEAEGERGEVGHVNAARAGGRLTAPCPGQQTCG